MAKQGQRHNDAGGQQSGRNNPKQSMEIITGTPKKKETYAERARQGKDPDPVAQHARPAAAARDHRDGNGLRADSPRRGRSGSQSNAGGA